MNWIFSLVVIALICLCGIIWYFIHLIGQNFSPNYKSESDYLKDEFEKIMGSDFTQPSQSYQPNAEPSYMAGLVDLIELSVSGLSFAQFFYLLLLILLFFIIIDIWFVIYPFSYMLNLIFGALAIGLFAFYATNTVNKALTRTLIASLNAKEESFGYMYNAGFALSGLLLSLIFGLYLMVYYFDVAVWGGEMKKEGMEKVGVQINGFMMGMLLAAFIYREAVSVMCRSLKTATFGLIKADLNLNINNQNISQLTRLLYMVSQQAGQIIVNYIDCGCVLAFITSAGMQLYVFSEEILGNDNKTAHLLGPVFWLCMTYLGALLCFFLKTVFQDQETGSFAALNVRWQVIIAAVISFLILISIPLSSIISNFTLKGEGTDAINFAGTSNIAGCWCCVLGLIVNVIHISMYEWYTSHGCPNVRFMCLASTERVMSMNFIYSNYLGDLFSSIPLLIHFVLIYVCYRLNGFAGMLFAATGYISLFMIYGIIFFVGATSTDAYKLTCFTAFKQSVQAKVFQIYWETRNYMIFYKVSNAGAVCLGAVGLIGAFLYQNAVVNSLFTKGNGILGLLIGACLMYVIKGINTWAIINISKDYFIVPPTETRVYYQTDMRVTEYTKIKYTQSIVYVCYNLLTVTFTVLLIGSLFGKDGTAGLLIGAALAGCLIQFSSLIKGTTLENSRIYNEIQEDRKDRLYIMYVSGETYGYASEESNATPLLIYLIYIFCLVASCHKRLGGESLFSLSKKE